MHSLTVAKLADLSQQLARLPSITRKLQQRQKRSVTRVFEDLSKKMVF